jgi:hypothetical protein
MGDTKSVWKRYGLSDSYIGCEVVAHNLTSGKEGRSSNPLARTPDQCRSVFVNALMQAAIPCACEVDFSILRIQSSPPEWKLDWYGPRMLPLPDSKADSSTLPITRMSLASDDKHPCKVEGCTCADFESSLMISTECVCGHGYEKHL